MSRTAAAAALAAWTFTRNQRLSCDAQPAPRRQAVPATDSRGVVKFNALDLTELHAQLSEVAGYTEEALCSAVDGLFRNSNLHVELAEWPTGPCLQLQPCSQDAVRFSVSNMALASNSTVCGHGVMCLL